MANGRGEPDSRQERLIHAFTGLSMGAPFVFHPDNYKGSDELADVVWACNDCVVLIYAKQVKSYPNHERNVRKSIEAEESNFAQARRWLSDWRSGQRLRGINSYQSFNLSYNQCRHVVVLSVIETGASFALMHDDLATKYGVAICATIPITLIEKLAQVHGSMVDMVNMLDALRRIEKKVSAEEMLEFAQAYYHNALASAKLTNLESDMTENVELATHLIYRMRLPQPDSTEASNDIYAMPVDAAKIFNDLSLEQYYGIIRVTAEMVTNIRKDLGQYGVTCVMLPFFSVCIGVNRLDGIKILNEKIAELTARARQEGSPVAIVIYWMLYPGQDGQILDLPTIAAHSRTGPSALRTFSISSTEEHRSCQTNNWHQEMP
jgi:hypothetical protein